MPSDVQLKVMNAVHKVVLKVSFGKIGGNLLGMPAFELITTGRKSGQPRSVMLTSPYEEGDTVAIVASKGGNDEHPAWYLNLRDNAEVEVRYPGEDAKPMTARIADAAGAGPAVAPHHRGPRQLRRLPEEDRSGDPRGPARAEVLSAVPSGPSAPGGRNDRRPRSGPRSSTSAPIGPGGPG